MFDQLPDEPSAPHLVSLLSCPSCEAPCPLGFTDSTRCVACGTEVPLSEEIRDAREQRRRHSAERRAADPLWQRARGFRVHFWRSPMLVAPLAFIAPFLAALPGYFFAYRHGRYGKAGFLWLATLGGMHLVTSVLLLGRKEEIIHGLLLARPPERPGGPPVCRVCAAPLSAPEGAWDCSCDHCGADNLLGEVDAGTSSRPDIADADAAFREVFGDEVNQRAARFYPITIFVGFLVLALMIYLAVEAPQGRN